jgi:DNA-directed RNA polymerase specialized sigma24 family protein
MTTGLRRSRRDSASVLDHWLRRHGTHVLHLAFHLVGDREQAEGVAAQVFARLSPLLVAGPGEDAAVLWALERATIRACRTTCLAASAAAATPGPTPPAPGAQAPAGSSPLYRALKELPLPERETAVLFFLLNRSTPEIAVLTGQSEARVQGLLARARQHLGGHLEQGRAMA